MAAKRADHSKRAAAQMHRECTLLLMGLGLCISRRPEVGAAVPLPGLRVQGPSLAVLKRQLQVVGGEVQQAYDKAAQVVRCDPGLFDTSRAISYKSYQKCMAELQNIQSVAEAVRNAYEQAGKWAPVALGLYLDVPE
jgi:hypothetical protein